MTQPNPLSPAETTRAALLDAGLHLFGQKGYSATSTREIAARAQTNIASIAYHFGGKDGLRLACSESLAIRLGKVIAAQSDLVAESPQAARIALHAVFRGIIQFLLGQADAIDLTSFMMRELLEGGPGLDKVYPAFLEPTHQSLCALWGTASGQPAESVAVRLAVFCAIGQIMYFRFGAPFVTRRMGWTRIADQELAAISETVLKNLDAMIEAKA